MISHHGCQWRRSNTRGFPPPLGQPPWLPSVHRHRAREGAGRGCCREQLTGGGEVREAMGERGGGATGWGGRNEEEGSLFTARGLGFSLRAFLATDWVGQPFAASWAKDHMGPVAVT